MSSSPACREYWPHLSPFVDGELPPGTRLSVERHLASCADCTRRVADFRAGSGLLRVGLEMAADDVDFSGFSQKVLAGLTPHRLPWLERLKLSVGERWTYQRGWLAGGVGMAAALVLAIPVWSSAQLALERAPAHLAVRSVTVDPGAHVAPVVMTNDQTGDAIIWLVDHEDHPAAGAMEPVSPTPPDAGPPGLNGPVRLPRDRPSGGDL